MEQGGATDGRRE